MRPGTFVKDLKYNIYGIVISREEYLRSKEKNLARPNLNLDGQIPVIWSYRLNERMPHVADLASLRAVDASEVKDKSSELYALSLGII